MGMKFETSWGVAPIIFKNTLMERVFEKMVSNFKNFSWSKRVTLIFFLGKFEDNFFLKKNLKGFLL